MAQYAQGVAYTRMFKMISSSDHLSLKTGLAPTVNVSKAGAAFAAAAGTVTEIADGWYKIALTTVDTGTLGDLAFYITATGADDTDFVDQVVAPALLASSYTAPPSAAAIATAVWTDTADLTTAGSPGKLIHDYLTGDAYARIGANGVGLTAVALVSTGLNAVLIDGKTLPAALQYIAAATAGKLSGAGTNTETFVGLDGTTTRLTATVDSSGNRSAITYG